MSSAGRAEKPDSGIRGARGDRWEPRDARRRRQLIEATISSIAQYGLPGTTVAKVAEIAGLSTGIVSFYFQSKKALLLSTLEYVNSEFEQMQQEALEGVGDDPVRQLKAMVQINFDPSMPTFLNRKERTRMIKRAAGKLFDEDQMDKPMSEWLTMLCGTRSSRSW